jgi:hypothetical protein
VPLRDLLAWKSKSQSCQPPARTLTGGLWEEQRRMGEGWTEEGVRIKRKEEGEKREHNLHSFFFFYSESKRCQVSKKSVSSAVLGRLCWQSFKTCKRIIKTEQLQWTTY